jgi:hypothetical protein
MIAESRGFGTGKSNDSRILRVSSYVAAKRDGVMINKRMSGWILMVASVSVDYVNIRNDGIRHNSATSPAPSREI